MKRFPFFETFLDDIGIDLGTANSIVYVRGQGIEMNESTVAALNTKTNRIIAVGEEARKMLGRTPPHINVIRPLVGGVISDFEMTQEYLRELLRRMKTKSAWGYRRAIVAIPNDLTEVERKSVEDAVIMTGCAHVYLVESPIAAALGAGLPIEEPKASLIVDIGGGTTDVAVISLGGIVVSRTIKIAGDRFNEEIIRFARDEFRLAVGESTAEYAKISVGAALPTSEKLEVGLRGRDIATGLPKEILLKDTHLRAALAKSLLTIVESTKEVLEAAPPELVGDILEHGIHLCGGGALLRGMGQLITRETGVLVRTVEDPLTCVARGLGHMVEEFEVYRNLLSAPPKPLLINV